MAVRLEWGDSGFPSEKIMDECRLGVSYVKELAAVSKNADYSKDAATIALPNEKKFLKASKAAAANCRNATLFILVGIGGSNLGAMASMEFLLGKSHNLLNPKKRMLFADTCDPDSIGELVRLLKSHIETNGKAVINIVSKSGTTTETAANFEAILGSLTKEERKSVKIVATTDSGSALDTLARKEKWAVLEIPQKVGGRYSVLSNVGLFPLCWLGVDAEAMLHGASKMLSACLSENPEKNPALVQASIMSLHAKAGKNILDSFLFSNSLSSYGLWYRQLLAESCGKGGNGLTPTVSIGTTDMHSQAQLYLGGRHDKAFRFIHAIPNENQLMPSSPIAPAISEALSGKSTSQIYSVLMRSMETASKKKSLPFWEISIGAKSEENLGALLQLDMVSVILFCRLQGVNPFDQPAVESYKSEAKRLLS